VTPPPSLWLGDLLAEQALGLELLTGGDEAATRPVLGAAVVEVKGPTEWVAKHWVMLTAGVGLGDEPEAGRALVRECEAAGVSALGFGVEPVFDHVPDSLIEEAAARGFPIFAVPKDTQFREIVTFVDTALSGGEAPLYRRLSSLQRYVADALRDPEPERAVVERLARFLDAGVAVLAPSGQPELATGKVPLDAVWEFIEDRPPKLVEAEIAGCRVVATPLASLAGEPPRWLVLASRSSGFAGNLVRSAAETTAPLLAAMERLREVVRNQEHAVKGALLDESLDPVDARDVPALAARAAGFELDFSQPARTVVVRECAALAAPVDLSVLGHELEEALGRTGAPHLLTERDGAVVALVQGLEGELRSLLDGLLAAQPGAVAGIGRPVTSVAAARHSHRDAELAARGASRKTGGRILAFEDFDLGTLLVSEAQPAWLGSKVEELIAQVRANPSLYEALKSWFEHDLDVAAAAATLHLHPNSLRYRLAKIEELIGRSLRVPATIADLHIALLAEGAGEAPDEPAAPLRRHLDDGGSRPVERRI
jgi:PucR family transcriptional regulator, purine catabolism regulatory protein